MGGFPEKTSRLMRDSLQDDLADIQKQKEALEKANQQIQEIRDNLRKKQTTKTRKGKTMKKVTKKEMEIPLHKRMAMGEKIELSKEGKAQANVGKELSKKTADKKAHASLKSTNPPVSKLSKEQIKAVAKDNNDVKSRAKKY